MIAEPLFGDNDFVLPKSSVSALQALLEGLPHDALTVFELPLAEPFPKLPDISQRVNRYDQAAHFLSRPYPPKSLDLLRSWHDARSDRGREDRDAGSSAQLPEWRRALSQTDSLWLELDLASRLPGHGGLPAPIYCLPLPNPCHDLRPWWSAIRRLPLKAAGRDPQARTLERALGLLSTPARPMYLFDLNARRPNWVRLELADLPHSQALDFLRRLGAPPPKWLDRLGPVARNAENIHLSFDIDPQGRIDDRIGWEASFRRLPSSDSRWQELIDEVAATGAGMAALKLISHWPRQFSKAKHAEAWPAHPAMRSGVFVRLLSHVKFVGTAQQSEPTPKIYLICQYIALDSKAMKAGSNGR